MFRSVNDGRDIFFVCKRMKGSELMSKSLYLPEGYTSALTLRETQHAIKYIKDIFQQALSIELMLDRVSAPYRKKGQRYK